MKSSQDIIELPLLPLRDVVVYPHMVIPLFVGRDKSIRALEVAMANDKQILLVAQKRASEDDPAKDDIYTVGTVASILQLLKLPDGTVKDMVEAQTLSKSSTAPNTFPHRRKSPNRNTLIRASSKR
jgi:ATP-dependent Lon protease